MATKIVYMEDAFTALQSGDERGLSYYFNQFYTKLLYYSQSLTQSETVAQDVVSDSFLKLWLHRDHLKQSSHVRNFLYLIVRNSSLNWIREQKKEKELENVLIQLMPITERHILEKLIETETYNDLYTAYKKLPHQGRQIFEMFYIQKMPVKRIASELSISVNTVKTHKLRALHFLRGFFNDHNLLFIITAILTARSI